jgi:amidase
MIRASELIGLDALDLADLVRRREAQPVELVRATIEAIEGLNPRLNAVVTPMFEQAVEAANEPLPPGPFCGVPFLLKDLLAAYAGVPMSSGSRLLETHIPDHDSELVVRFKRAGVIVVGKTNTPEFGLQPTTEPELFGPTRNPWDPTRTAGGSSGGAAAAVAAGLTPFAHANDGGGSIRIPASCCGIFGLKPTRARTPLGPDFGDLLNGLVVEHAVTRSVRDCAALLDATSGPDVGDPYWAPPPARPYLQEIGAAPERLRIALSRELPNGPKVHADCVAAVEDAAKLCEVLGHRVEEACPAFDFPGTLELFTGIWAAGCAQALEGITRLHGLKIEMDRLEPLTRALYRMGASMSATDYLLRVNALQLLARGIGRFFVDYDVWLTPTLAEPPTPLGAFAATPEEPLRGFLRATAFTPFTPLCNITGQPAMSVPLYWNTEGLPIGAHFVGRFGDETTLFRLASQLESERPWAKRWPALSVHEQARG